MKSATKFILSLPMINNVITNDGLSCADHLDNLQLTLLHFKSQDMDGGSYISKMTFKMLLALSAALFGAFLAWPGIRLAKVIIYLSVCLSVYLSVYLFIYRISLY